MGTPQVWRALPTRGPEVAAVGGSRSLRQSSLAPSSDSTDPDARSPWRPPTVSPWGAAKATMTAWRSIEAMALQSTARL